MTSALISHCLPATILFLYSLSQQDTNFSSPHCPLFSPLQRARVPIIALKWLLSRSSQISILTEQMISYLSSVYLTSQQHLAPSWTFLIFSFQLSGCSPPPGCVLPLLFSFNVLLLNKFTLFHGFKYPFNTNDLKCLSPAGVSPWTPDSQSQVSPNLSIQMFNKYLKLTSPKLLSPNLFPRSLSHFVKLHTGPKSWSHPWFLSFLVGCLQVSVSPVGSVTKTYHKSTCFSHPPCYSLRPKHHRCSPREIYWTPAL